MPAWIDPTLQPISHTPYELFTSKATCPTCRQRVWLMTPKIIKDQNAAPTFALCFSCGAVMQVGVGLVPKVEA